VVGQVLDCVAAIARTNTVSHGDIAGAGGGSHSSAGKDRTQLPCSKPAEAPCSSASAPRHRGSRERHSSFGRRKRRNGCERPVGSDFKGLEGVPAVVFPRFFPRGFSISIMDGCQFLSAAA